jgi:hypothetical protein
MSGIWNSPYRLRPINRQAARLLRSPTNRIRKQRRRRAKSAVDSPFRIRRQAVGRKCPICGKLKIGLEDHIRAKHPSQSGSVRYKTIAVQPKPQVARRISPTALISTRTPATSEPNTRSCQHCGRRFVRLEAHIKKAHLREAVECPFCCDQFKNQSTGRRRCPSCRRFFTLKRNYALKGAHIECPSCMDEFYTEKPGKIRCSNCQSLLYLNKNLTLRKV